MQGHDTERTKEDGSWLVQCVECQREFESVRYDASFCSGACRSRNARRPKKLQNAIDALEQFGRIAKDTSETYPNNQRVFEAMLKLKADVESALQSFTANV